MKRARQSRMPLETQLGLLAMRFRGTRDEAERNAVTEEYAQVVERLISSGKWKEMPSFEDMLPDERLPLAFFVHWEIPCPQGQNGNGRAATK